MSEDDFTKLPLDERLDHKVLFIFDIVFAHLRFGRVGRRDSMDTKSSSLSSKPLRGTMTSTNTTSKSLLLTIILLLKSRRWRLSSHTSTMLQTRKSNSLFDLLSLFLVLEQEIRFLR